MSRHFPSMKKHSWIILVCTIIGLLAGALVAKAQPPGYLVNTTLLVDAGAPGTALTNINTSANAKKSGTTISPKDNFNQASDDAAEILSRSVMNFVYQSDPTLKQHHYTADGLLTVITDTLPSQITSTIQVTATTTKPGDAVLLANDVANGYVAFKNKRAQDELAAERAYLQNLFNQYKTQSDQVEQKILSYSNASDPHIALLTADHNALIASMDGVQAQLQQLPPTVRGDVFVVQPAKLSDVTPTYKALEYFGIIAAVGLMLGLLIWLLMIFLDYRLQGEDQVPEKLGLDYLGTLSKIKEIQPGSIPTTGLAAQQLADISVSLQLMGILPGAGRAPQGAVLLITSAQPGEGKTTVATGLAAAAARGGRSVLMIDGNLRQPATHLAFGMTPTGYGLSELLKAIGGENLDAAVQRTNIPGVWLLAGGTAIDDPTSLLEQRMPVLLAQLRKKTDWIIIDGPDLLSDSEASLLASMADGVAMVVDERYDKMTLLLRARAVLRSLTRAPAGIIMNRVSTRKDNPYHPVAYAEDVAVRELLAGDKHSSDGKEDTVAAGQAASTRG